MRLRFPHLPNLPKLADLPKLPSDLLSYKDWDAMLRDWEGLLLGGGSQQARKLPMILIAGAVIALVCLLEIGHASFLRKMEWMTFDARVAIRNLTKQQDSNYVLLTLLSFSGSNGSHPYGSLTLGGSALYGTTYQGGTNNDGTVFALNIAPAAIALCNVSNATIISGGTATVGMTVSNSPNSGYNLNFTLGAAVQGGSGTLGTVTSGTGGFAPGASQSCGPGHFHQSWHEHDLIRCK